MKRNEEYLKNYEEKKRMLPILIFLSIPMVIFIGFVFNVVPLEKIAWFMFWLLFANVVYAIWLRLSGRWPSR